MTTKTTVIHHSADYDGIFCREIARKFLPEAEIIGWDFADKALDESLLSHQLIVMDLPVDRPFGLEFKNGWICKNGDEKQPIDRWDHSNITWIDHHASSIANHPDSLGGYRIDGVAACRLAWQWFTQTGPDNPKSDPVLARKQDFIDRKVLEPSAVRLAGEYDIWDKRDPDAELFQHGLRSRELHNDDWHQLLSVPKPSIDDIERLIDAGHKKDLLNPDGTANPPIVWQLLEAGRAIQYAHKRQDEFVAKNRSFDVEFEGLKFMAINAVRCNSLTFEAATRPDHDALMGFYWDGKQWNVSMYHAPHRKDLDLSAIAIKYGGGGHRGACGYRTAKLPFIP